MSIVDRQHIAAVRAMEALGYTFDGVVWNIPVADARGRGLLRARLPSAGGVRRDHPGSFLRIAGPVGLAAVNEDLLQGPECEQRLAATHVLEPKRIGPACMARPGMSGATD